MLGTNQNRLIPNILLLFILDSHSNPVKEKETILTIDNEYDLSPFLNEISEKIQSDTYETIVLLGRASLFGRYRADFFNLIKQLTNLKRIYFEFGQRNKDTRLFLEEELDECPGLEIHIGSYCKNLNNYETEDYFHTISRTGKLKVLTKSKFSQ